MTSQFQTLILNSIVEGPNVRSDLGDLTDMIESVKQHGILEPVMVREVWDADAREMAGGKDVRRHELVFGFRRFAAARAAGLAELPCMVRTLSDDEVLELQLVENVARADMDPVDEAGAYQKLVAHGRTSAEIAAKMGRPPSYVAQRLRLATLSPSAKADLQKGKITLGVALLVAKLPTHALQDKALEEVGSDADMNDSVLTVEEARRRIETHVMRSLKDADFDRTRLDLVPTAGPCTTCPKRTGAQAELFSDASSPDLCSDPVCFRAKQDAHWEERKRTAKAEGIEVLSKKAAQEELHGYGAKKEFRKLSDEVWVGDKRKSVKQLLGGKEARPVAIARDEQTGAVVELVPAADVERAIKEARKDDDGVPERTGPSAAQKREQEEREAERERARVLTEKLVAGVESLGRKNKFPTVFSALLPLLVRAAIASTWNETHRKIVSRRKLETEADKKERLGPAEILAGFVDACDMPARLGLLVELLIGRDSFEAEDFDDEDAFDFIRGGVVVSALEVLGLPTNVDAKPKTGKAKSSPGAVVHLLGLDGRNACGAKASSVVGYGERSTLEGVTCKNCQRVGPAVMEQKAVARAKPGKKKPKGKSAKKAAKRKAKP